MFKSFIQSSRLSIQHGTRHLHKNSISARIPTTKFKKYVIYPTLLIGSTGGTIYVIDNVYYSSLLTRSIKAVYVLLWIGYQYGYNSNSYQSIDQLHEIASESLLQLLIENKGLYIKIGQAIANQGQLFPMAYQNRFPKLYDNAPYDDWKKVDKVLKANLGSDYESEIFEYVDHDPIASASIAQVHKAKLKKNGKEIALKVQHDYIGKQIVVDLWVYKFVTKIYEKIFDLPLSVFTGYVSEQLMKETNFIHEMNNSIKMRKIIESDHQLSNIKIPKSYPEYTTKQVLPAEWIDGLSLTHKSELLQNGFDLKLMMNQYINLFNKQIFKYGFVHADPHPANLKINRDINGKQQLVLLDHGLYINLPDKFRLQYCQLWKDIFTLDQKGISEIGKDWGINSIELFATFIQMKPIIFRKNRVTNDTRDVSDLLKDFIGDQSRFPRELPFLARTMRMIQNLNQQMGSPVNRINLLTNEAVNCLSTDNISWIDYFSLIKVKLNLMISNLIFYLIRFRQFLNRKDSDAKGIEDYIELYMQNTAKSIGINWT